ncbi:MAG: membrane protein insertion efficiency factor YidD [Candidatus Krumholzibacteriota bacterium]|nr:membrane protein insertion efficiency factor YidD [Candidatus Krumholzibacteriota bacterium]
MLKNAGLKAVQIYRIAISPYHAPVCRFTPTCSQYAEEAISRYGLFKGGYKAFRRILKCHPFSAGGFDPVG